MPEFHGGIGVIGAVASLYMDLGLLPPAQAPRFGLVKLFTQMNLPSGLYMTAPLESATNEQFDQRNSTV